MATYRVIQDPPAILKYLLDGQDVGCAPPVSSRPSWAYPFGMSEEQSFSCVYWMHWDPDQSCLVTGDASGESHPVSITVEDLFRRVWFVQENHSGWVDWDYFPHHVMRGIQEGEIPETSQSLNSSK